MVQARSAGAMVLAWALAIGCGGPDPAPIDGGDDAPRDAATDAPPADPDASTVDGGSADAGAPDAGPADAAPPPCVPSAVSFGPAVGTDELWLVRAGSPECPLVEPEAAPAFVDRVRLSDGSVIGSIALPTRTDGAQHALSLSTYAFEGGLGRSPNGRFVALAGYDAPPGTRNVSTIPASLVPRVVARLDAEGSIDTTTALDVFSSSWPFAALPADSGDGFWVAGSSGFPTAGTLFYATRGATGVAVIETGHTATVRLDATGGRLWALLYGTSDTGLVSFGASLPTTGPQTPEVHVAVNNLGPPSALGIVGAGETVYVIENRIPATLQRWDRAGTTYSRAWVTPSAALGLVVRAGASGTTIHAIENGAATELVERIDTSATEPPTRRTIATAPAGTQWRGIAWAPTP